MQTSGELSPLSASTRPLGLSIEASGTGTALQEAILDACAFIIPFAIVSLLVGASPMTVSTLIWTALIFVISNTVLGLYAPKRTAGSMTHRAAVLIAVLIGSVGLMTAFLDGSISGRLGRPLMILCLLATYLIALWHHVRIHQRHLAHRPRTLWIELADEEDRSDQSRTQTDRETVDTRLKIVRRAVLPPIKSGQPHGSSTERLSQEIESHDIECITGHPKTLSDRRLVGSLSQMRLQGVEVISFQSLHEEIHGTVPLRFVTPEWWLNASSAPHPFYLRMIKRIFDLIVSSLALLVLSPLFLLVGLALHLSGGSAVLDRKLRAGQSGKPFQLLRFRLTTDSRRASWINALIRHLRLDSLPQLLNVIRGDMSLVGPRPECPTHVEAHAQNIPYYRERLWTRPGLTGWAQVQFSPQSVRMDPAKATELDLYYLKNMGLILDLHILARSIRHHRS